MLDGGDALFREVAVPEGPPGDLSRGRAEVVARAFQRIGVGAVNVGRRDLAAGLGFVGALGRDPGVPWVATNLRTSSGDYPFPRWRVLAWGDARIGVVGVLAPDPTRDPALGIRVGDPAAAVREALAALDDVDAVICLANLGLDAERELARQVPALRAIVGGMTNHQLATPLVEGGTLVLRAADRGRYLGVLEVPRGALAAWRDPVDARERDLLARRAENLRATLEAFPPERAEGAERRLELVAGQLRAAEAALARFDGDSVTFRHRLLPLDTRVGEDREVAGWVAAFHAAEARGRASRAAPKPHAAVVPSRPASRGPFHTGTAACRSCHADAYRAWVGTPHARAAADLKDRSRDPQCLGCHASRLTRATGPTVEPVVGCEACHGPGGNHRGRGNVARRPPEAACRECHGAFHPNQAFDYAKGLARIRCDRPGKL